MLPPQGLHSLPSLQISPVPRLLGHFPLTITMCLRAMALHSISARGAAAGATSGLVGRRGGASKEGAGGAGSGLVLDTLAVLFQRPFYAEKDPGLLQQVQHLFRFTAEYLACAGAIDERGEPLGEACPCPLLHAHLFHAQAAAGA